MKLTDAQTRMLRFLDYVGQPYAGVSLYLIT